MRFRLAISEAESPFFLRNVWRFGSVNAEIASDCDCAILRLSRAETENVLQPRCRTLLGISKLVVWGELPWFPPRIPLVFVISVVSPCPI